MSIRSTIAAALTLLGAVVVPMHAADASPVDPIMTVAGADATEGLATTVGVSPTGVAVTSAAVYYAATNLAPSIARLYRLDRATGYVAAVPGVTNARGAVVAGPAGSVYVTVENQVIQVGADGTITPVAGTGAPGFSGDGFAATTANLDGPNALAVDGDGNLFISDGTNGRVRKVDTGGIISTVAGGGSTPGNGVPATSVPLWPTGVAVRGSTLFVTDAQAPPPAGPSVPSLVRSVVGGVITTVAGGGASLGDGGPALSARLSGARQLAVDGSGNLLIADHWNERVRRVDTAGVITTAAGGGALPGDGGPATSARIGYVEAVTVGADGRMVIASSGPFESAAALARVREVSPGGRIHTLAGTPDGGDLLGLGMAAYTYNGELSTTAPDGTLVGSTTRTTPDGRLWSRPPPNGQSVYAPNGDLFIAARGFVIKETSSGTRSIVAGTGLVGYNGDTGPAVSALVTADTIALGPSGEVFVADTVGARVRRVDPSGTIDTVAGNGTQGSAGDGGPGYAAQLNGPEGLAVDAAGNLFIADTLNSKIRKVAPGPGGVISTFFTFAALTHPRGLAFDGPNLIATATDGNQVVSISPGGASTVVAGTGVAGFSGDGGAATAATLRQPNRVATDSAGHLFVYDATNHRVRRVGDAVAPGPPTALQSSAGIGEALVRWLPPASTGGWPIDHYDVIVSGGPTISVPGFQTSTIVTGLANGVPASITVRAATAVGDGPASGPTTTTPSVGLSSPPLAVVAARHGLAVDVSWDPPADTAGQPVTGYVVTAEPSGASVTVGNTTAASLNGVPSAETTFVRVSAVTANGPSEPSAPSNAIGPITPGDSLYAQPPARVLDTRSATQVGPYSTPFSQTPRPVTVAGVGGVPVTAHAVVANVTVTDATAASFLTVWPTGQPKPLASTINWVAGQTIANNLTVPVGPDGTIQIFNAGGTVDVVIDIVGWYDGSAGDALRPQAPARVLDSRPATRVGPYSTPWPEQAARPVTVAGVGGVPSWAHAAVANVTVTDATAASFLTVWPTGQPKPLASTINWVAGQTIANNLTVPVGPDGTIQIFNAGGTVDVVIDIVGWYG